MEFQVHGSNVHPVPMDTFDYALLPLQNAFDFQTHTESIYADPIYVGRLHNLPATSSSSNGQFLFQPLTQKDQNSAAYVP